MFKPFGSANRKTQDTGPIYDFRTFETTDARQYALDDYHVITTSQSGLAGLMPLHMLESAQQPSGFDWATNLSLIGGQPSPISQQPTMPLIDQPQFAKTFIEETTGLNDILF